MFSNNMKLYLLIYIKRYKLSAEGKSPLYLRISINGTRAEIALSRNVTPENWDSKRQCVKGRSPEASSINETIRVFKTKVFDLFNKFLDNGEFISAEKLKNAFLGINQGSKTICQAFEYHNTKMHGQIGKDFALGTYKRYETCLRLLNEFISSHYKKTDFSLNEINLAFVTEFDYFLRTMQNPIKLTCSFRSKLTWFFAGEKLNIVTLHN
jgi:hypothetical protein